MHRLATSPTYEADKVADRLIQNSSAGPGKVKKVSPGVQAEKESKKKSKQKKGKKRGKKGAEEDEEEEEVKNADKGNDSKADDEPPVSALSAHCWLQAWTLALTSQSVW